MLQALKRRARRLEAELTVLHHAYRDPRTPLASKAAMALVLAYALSPIDLIPDFIPVLGYLDDLLLLPLGIALALRLVPRHVLEEHRSFEPGPRADDLELEGRDATERTSDVGTVASSRTRALRITTTANVGARNVEGLEGRADTNGIRSSCRTPRGCRQRLRGR